MAFDDETKNKVGEYLKAHVADETWHDDFFNFVSDDKLSKRLSEEFISTRYIYKMLEGMEATGWLQRAQIRSQVLSYASIYEATLHHILFVDLIDHPQVIALTEFPMKKVISIPQASFEVLKKHLMHDGKEIVPTYVGVGKTDESKVRFDKKAECAADLGIIEQWLRDDLIEFYEARNSIHIHAEIRKSLNYELDLSRRAYRRLQPFKDQIVTWQTARSAS